MGIFTRFRDIVNSNLNSILDKAEDPEKMVRLMIQEMEDTLIEVKSSCAAVIASQKRLERELADSETQTTQWEEKAKLAIKKKREDLAKQALGEKQAYARRAQVLREEMEHTKTMVTNFQSDIAQLEGKLNDARDKQRTIIQRRAAAQVRYTAQTKIRHADTTEAFAKFEAYENGIERLEAETGLVNSLRPKENSLREQFNNLEHEEEIARELESLKKQVQEGK